MRVESLQALRRGRWGRDRLPDRPEAPGLLDALQPVLAAILELMAAADREIPNGRRGEHLARRRGLLDAGREVYRQADDVVVSHLAFAGVQARADLDAQIGSRGLTPQPIGSRAVIGFAAERAGRRPR